jgi:hypothetical protein
MSKVVLDQVQEMDQQRLKKGTYILLLNANKVPPHLGLISEGKYYSLTANESQIAVDGSSIWRMVQTKQIPALFIEVNSFGSEEILADVFGQFERAIPGKVSCLQPLKSYFSSVHQISMNSVNYVFDLVEQLEAHDLLLGSYHQYLENDLINGSFTMITYSMEEIYDRITKLQKQITNA